MPEGRDINRDGTPRLNWDRNRPPNEQIVDLEGRPTAPAQPYEDDLEPEVDPDEPVLTWDQDNPPDEQIVDV